MNVMPMPFFHSPKLNRRVILIFTLFLYIFSFSNVHAEIIKCKNASGLVRYASTEIQQGRNEIQSLEDKGMTCDNIDKRTSEQKLIDAKVQKERLRIEHELAVVYSSRNRKYRIGFMAFFTAGIQLSTLWLRHS